MSDELVSVKRDNMFYLLEERFMYELGSNIIQLFSEQTLDFSSIKTKVESLMKIEIENEIIDRVLRLFTQVEDLSVEIALRIYIRQPINILHFYA